MQNKELTFSDEDGNLVVVLKNTAKILLTHRQLCASSNEAAGVLIGERRGSHLVICDISEPGEGDIRHRCSVNRKGPHHQAKVNLAFKLSKGTQQYIGEWHTHPEDIPTPSFRDRCSWESNLTSQKPMVVIIVGREKMWVARKKENSIYPMTLISQS